jgi:hypothetical protein
VDVDDDRCTTLRNLGWEREKRGDLAAVERLVAHQLRFDERLPRDASSRGVRPAHDRAGVAVALCRLVATYHRVRHDVRSGSCFVVLASGRRPQRGHVDDRDVRVQRPTGRGQRERVTVGTEADTTRDTAGHVGCQKIAERAVVL